VTAALRPAAATGFVIKPAPLREPPYDDEIPARHLSVVGPLDSTLPFDADPSAPSAHRLGQRTGTFDLQPTGRSELPALGPFARQFVIGVVESATGRRPASQLRWQTSPGVQAGLVRDSGRSTRLGTSTRPARLHSVHIVEPADGVAEIAAVLQIADRFRAIAFRLEGLDGRWRCVRLQIG
jgi:hypothetical protein